MPGKAGVHAPVQAWLGASGPEIFAGVTGPRIKYEALGPAVGSAPLSVI